MADNEVLVGTAMLNAVWSKQHNDMLDLILPFVKYAIGRKYKKGDRIEPGEIAACLNEELGYESIPHEVVATMLKRLSPSVLDRRRSEFWLKVGLEKDVKSYSDQRLAMKERHEKVGSTLAAYLSKKAAVRLRRSRNPYAAKHLKKLLCRKRIQNIQPCARNTRLFQLGRQLNCAKVLGIYSVIAFRLFEKRFII